MRQCDRVLRLNALQQRLEIEPTEEPLVLVLALGELQEILLCEILQFNVLLASLLPDFSPLGRLVLVV